MSWFANAACHGADIDLFFPERGVNPVEAKALCAACPVQVECRKYADDMRQIEGVWGGESWRKRRRRWEHESLARHKGEKVA